MLSAVNWSCSQSKCVVIWFPQFLYFWYQPWLFDKWCATAGFHLEAGNGFCGPISHQPEHCWGTSRLLILKAQLLSQQKEHRVWILHVFLRDICRILKPVGPQSPHLWDRDRALVQCCKRFREVMILLKHLLHVHVIKNLNIWWLLLYNRLGIQING